MKRLKIALLGGGSGYFEWVIGEVAAIPELEGASLALYDIDRRRMDLVRHAGRRTLEKMGKRVKLTATTDLPRALDGTDFAISSIGVHGPGARWHKTDCDVCARFGIIHTTGDTVGPAGISQGLRLIPIYHEIAQAMRRYCPDIILLNHSNPMAAICRAVWKHSGIRTIGYCHNVAGDVHWFAKLLGVPPHELDPAAAGVNHMVWLLGLRHQGRDVLPDLKRRILDGEPQERHVFAREVLQLLDVFPIGGDRHMVEFYPHAREATRPEELKYGMRWRSMTIEEGRLALELSKQPTELELRARGLKPPVVPDRVSPESMGEQVRALAFGPEKIHFVNTPNRGAVPNLPDWAVLELKAVVGAGGARPIYVGDLPPQCARWSLNHVFVHELVVDAAVEGSRAKALQAMACDAMTLNFHEVEPLFDALVEAQTPRLDRFRRRGA